MRFKGKKRRVSPSLWLIGGLALVSAGAIAYAQSSFKPESTRPTETTEATETAATTTEPLPPPDPLLDKAFHEIYAFCSRPASPHAESLNPPALTTAQPSVPTHRDRKASPSQAPDNTAQNTVPTDPCANFKASFASFTPSPPKEPVPTESILDRITHLFSPPKSTPAAAPVLPPLPPSVEGIQLHQMAKLAKVPILMYHDIVAKKEVFFDVTPEELEAQFQYLQSQGMTPISPDWLLAHLKTGIPLPNKPVLLSFDDGYGGHYQYVFPLLKKYNYPALFSIYIDKMKGTTKRTSVTWDQLKEMAASPLVTIAAHSVTHPKDLRTLSDAQLATEVFQSKQILEQNLGIPIHYFTYPEGKYDDRVKQAAIAAGYKAAFTMDVQEADEHYAGESPDVMAIGRFGQSRTREVAPEAWGGYPAPVKAGVFDFTTPIEKRDYVIDKIRFTLVSGGKPSTIHADSRYQVPKILEGTGAIAGVDGAFFSLKSLNSNVMIGPVMSLGTGFVPGNNSENPRLNGRPLVLISAQRVRFIPFDATKHGTFKGIIAEAGKQELITDAFVGAAWLVRDGKPQPAEAFGSLYSFDVKRNRAFWGINQAGQPVIGVSHGMIDSVALGQALYQMGLRDAIMVDSGASTSLAFEGKSMVEYTPRPVPHVVALYPPLKTQPAPISSESEPSVAR